MALYKSEITNFLDDLKKKNPEIELNQRKGRNLLWDKASLNLDEYKRKQEAEVKQKAYVYSTE